MNTRHLLKVVSAWMSIVYTVCFAGAALVPGIRPGFMMYGLHMGVNIGQNVLTIETFISGLVIWNIITLLAVLLFIFLYKKIKR